MTPTELLIHKIESQYGNTPTVVDIVYAMRGLIPGLADVIDGKAVIAPKVATADMLATYEAYSHHSDGQWERFTISQDDYGFMIAASPYGRNDA